MIKNDRTRVSPDLARALAATVVNGIFVTALGAMLWLASGTATAPDHHEVRPAVTIAVVAAP